MSLVKKAIGGSIHRIREFELEKVNLIDEFDILQIVGEGWFGKILLTEHRSTQTEMVLKALPKAYTGITDFFREFHYGLHLAAHRNIITTYDVAFETAGFYVFSQEYAPLGDLTSNVTETGLGELHAKRVARQLAAAIHHIHSRELVHRDIKLDNILIFRSDFSRIKLCDFGETRRVNTVVRRHNEWLPYSPPEVLQIDTDETYKALMSHDVWQFGIVLFVCLTGCLPWQKAALDDPRYTRYQNWHNATLNIAKKPKLFQLISSRAQRMFKRLLDPRAEKRPVSVLEVNKYLEDRWLAKLGAEKALNGGADETDELCPSMYSFHSSLEEKNQLLHTLTTYGIETTVNRAKKKDRIREWIQSSGAIVEENEEDEESDLNEEVEPEYLEDEDEEPVTMKGRHFPERRPSVKSGGDRGARKKRKDSSAGRKRTQVTKKLERKIPFAPQVAEERETIARFASFPNGDPSLAIAKNGTNGTLANPAAIAEKSAGTKVEVANVEGEPLTLGGNNGQVGDNSSGNSMSTSQEDSMQTTSSTSTNLLANNGMLTRNVIDDLATFEKSLKETRNGRIPPASPQVPSRKHRSQTAPFPSPTSPNLEDTRKEFSKRTQSASSLSTQRTESFSNPSIEKPLVTPADSNQTSLIRSERPGVLPVARVEAQPPTAPIPGRREKSPPSPVTNPLTMSVASHLVMQSFNALQGISAMQQPSTSSSTVSSTPKSPPNSTRTSSSPPSTKGIQRPEEIAMLAYRKDPFEHYGIAQGVVLRLEPTRRDSTSGSRSVSN